ncbi:MAG: DUF421 domain-containing protein [Christensenellales bacterium]
MLVIIIRTLIILFFLMIGVRLMGKRTIGELQPYEFVITLAVADLACVPMQDVSVPITYGLVPLIVLFITHYVITAIMSKSIPFRKFVNGKPMIVIDGDGINSECLTKLNMDVNDLISLIRQQGYFSIPEISFGILETNGKLSVMQNENATPPSSIPMTLVVEGKYMRENMESINITEEKVNSLLDEKKIKIKDVVLMTADSGSIFVQPRNAKYFTIAQAG